MMTEIEFY